MINYEPKVPVKGKLKFRPSLKPADYPADRRVMERRVLVVNTTKRLVNILLFVIFFTVTCGGITGIIVHSRFDDLNRKLMVEDLSVPPIDIAIDQPIDSFEVEEEPPKRRSR